MSTTLNHRRWFRFRLRTILLIVALLAIPCAWLGSEWKLVRARAALIERVEAAGGTASSVKYYPLPSITIQPGAQSDQISAARRWLGDRAITQITIPDNFSDDDEKQILDRFPETEVVKYWPFDPSRQPRMFETH
jgi:hypothetical protein